MILVRTKKDAAEANQRRFYALEEFEKPQASKALAVNPIRLA
jgi:hypothetical protein